MAYGVSQVSLKNSNDLNNFPDTQSHSKSDKGHYGNRQFTTAEKRYLVEVNSKRPDALFSRDSNGRRFSNFHYEKTLKSGLVTERSWLYNSSILIQCYCLSCWIFSESKDLLATGFHDWIHLQQTLSRHKSKNKHNLSCSIFDKWRLNRTVDSELQKTIREEESFYRKILTRIIVVG